MKRFTEHNPFVPWYGCDNLETGAPIITHCGKSVEPARWAETGLEQCEQAALERRRKLEAELEKRTAHLTGEKKEFAKRIWRKIL